MEKHKYQYGDTVRFKKNLGYGMENLEGKSFKIRGLGWNWGPVYYLEGMWFSPYQFFREDCFEGKVN